RTYRFQVPDLGYREANGTTQGERHGLGAGDEATAVSWPGSVWKTHRSRQSRAQWQKVRCAYPSVADVGDAAHVAAAAHGRYDVNVAPAAVDDLSDPGSRHPDSEQITG